MTQKYNIAVAGATGAVGTEIVQILEQRDFPIDNLYLLASSKSKGKKVEFKDKENIFANTFINLNYTHLLKNYKKDILLCGSVSFLNL